MRVLGHPCCRKGPPGERIGYKTEGGTNYWQSRVSHRSQDFVPYLSRLLPLVHAVLVDPVPEARATAAKALGTLVERLGEEQFPDMVPNLLKVLKTDTSGVDRQGAAQGLSEVLAGLGMERLEALLPDIVSNAQSPRSTRSRRLHVIAGLFASDIWCSFPTSLDENRWSYSRWII